MDKISRKEEATDKKSTSLLKNFQKYLKNDPELKNTIEFDIVEHSFKKIDGNEGFKCECIITNPLAVVDYVFDIPTSRNVTLNQYWKAQSLHYYQSS